MSRFSDTIVPRLLWVSVGFNLATVLVAALVISAPGPFAHLAIEWLITRTEEFPGGDFMDDAIPCSVEYLKGTVNLTEAQYEQLEAQAEKAMEDGTAIMERVEEGMGDLLLHIISHTEDQAGIEQRWERLVKIQQIVPLRFISVFRNSVRVLTPEQRSELERQVRTSDIPFWFDALLPSTYAFHAMDDVILDNVTAPDVPD